MPPETLFFLCLGVFIIAVLYSAVGHAGASGYIAVMSLMGLSPLVIKPIALALNILVAAIATVQFVRAGHFSWPLFWPFALLAAPAAFLGGYIHLPIQGFKVVVGLILLYSAARLLWLTQRHTASIQPPVLAALAVGACIGFLSGLTGTGGGIFLTPMILLMRWADPKPAAAVSALFILLNSVAGLLGNIANTQTLPPFLWLLLCSVGLGGLIGSYVGSRQLAAQGIKRFLAVVLLIAGTKLILT